MDNIKLLYIDLFCGAGGTSTGVIHARVNGKKCAKVIACVNHDKNAILSHAANHPDTLHFTEDIRTLELSPLVNHLNAMRTKHPEAYVVLWASCECTNFSRAKGGLPREADSRTLAEHLYRYIETLNPDFIQVENVEEFMCWGDLDANGKPVSRYNGKYYVRWANHIQNYGYEYDFRILNAADFGAYTSRKRYFGQFAKKGLPLAFPVQTHSRMGGKEAMFGEIYKPWKPVKDVLDLFDEGTSIFGRSKPLCEKTLERIYAGLIKFVGGGKKQVEGWILKYNSMNTNHQHNAPSLDEPCPTVATQNRLGLVKCRFLSKQFSGDPDSKNISLNGPAGTITTIDHHALVNADFLSTYYGNGYNSSIEAPSPTLTTKDRLNKVKICFLDNQYGNGSPTDAKQPSPTITQNPKQNLVTVKQFLMNPQFESKGGSIDKPCFTLIARMDKLPPYLISTDEGVAVAIYEEDSPMTRKIKMFMAMYNIADIKMRMLKIAELKRIMGFPEDYILVGTQSEQKKYIGNAVEVNMSRALCEALCNKLNSKRNTVAV